MPRLFYCSNKYISAFLTAVQKIQFDAAAAFGEPLSLTIFDPAHSENEDRFLLLGQSTFGNLIVVSHTARNGTIRIISARLANRRERFQYESKHQPLELITIFRKARQHTETCVDLNQITIPCKNYEESVAFYIRLGLRQIVDSPPRYARFETNSLTTLSIHAAGSSDAQSGTVIYFEVEDVDESVERLKQAGLEFESDPTDQSWLWREAYLRDPSGNKVCIYHAGENRRYPPWRIAGDAV